MPAEVELALWVLGAAVYGLLAGALVPRIIGALPEPVPDPAEDPEDFPAKVPYADLAARRGLRARCALTGAAVSAVLGAATGVGWALPWLLVLVPFGLALAVVDYVTWYLPAALVWRAGLGVVALQGVAALALGEPRILLQAGIGFAATGAYYGLLWLLSPRIMAFGDVRLAAVLGLALGPFGLGTVLLAALAAALVGAVALPVLRRTGNSIRRHVPFGPFLLVGAVLAVVVGQLVVGT